VISVGKLGPPESGWPIMRADLVEPPARADRQAHHEGSRGNAAEEPLSVDRLIYFSDAVFAIAATLLVLDIGIPPGLDSPGFHRALVGVLPAIAVRLLREYHNQS
jgi:Endosomal/lysosomal potassium channel TMEM175